MENGSYKFVKIKPEIKTMELKSTLPQIHNLI